LQDLRADENQIFPEMAQTIIHKLRVNIWLP